MLPQLSQLVPLFFRYKYFIIFPIAVIEGPIITIIAGFLASLGYLNFFGVYAVIVVGDLVGDSFYYSIGRFGRKSWVLRYGRYFGINPAALEKLERHFDQYADKTFALGKIAHGVGALFLVASGLAKVPYWRMLKYNILPTVIKSLALLLVGFYFGKAYVKIDQYLNYAAIILPVLFVLLYWILIKTKVLAKLINKL